MGAKKTFNVMAISPTPTHRTVRGNRQRIFQVLRKLQSMGGTIHFVYFPREWECKLDPVEMEMMKEQWDQVHLINPNGFPPDAPQGSHHYIDEWYDDNIGNYCNWLSWGTFFDIVIVNYAFFSKTLELLNPNFLRVLDTHDQLAGRKELLLANGAQPEFFYTTEPEENKAFERSDVILAIKKEEQLAFCRRTDKPVVRLGHSAEIPVREHKTNAKKILIGYLGSDNSINKAGLARFVEHFSPVLARLGGKAELHIAGLISEFSELEFAGLPNIVVRGRVKSVEAFYADVDLVVSPFDFGTGLKIKTVEAIINGCAVMGTNHAFDGLETTEKQHLYATCRELAEACADLLEGPNPVGEIARLQQISETMLTTFSKEFDDVLGGLVNLSRMRRMVFVPVEDFYLESTPAQLRSANMIRELSDKFHLHVVYPYHNAEPDRLSAALQSWQWKNSFHLNEEGLPEAAFVESCCAALTPRIAISALPIANVDADIFVADLLTGNLLTWKRIWNDPTARQPDRIFIVSEECWAELENSPLHLQRTIRYCVGMLDRNRYVRNGQSILIQCADPSLYATEINACVTLAALSGRSAVKVVLVSDLPFDGFVDAHMSTAEAALMSSREFGLNIELGPVQVQFVEIRRALMSNGAPTIMTFPPGSPRRHITAAEFGVAGTSELRILLDRFLNAKDVRANMERAAIETSHIYNAVEAMRMVALDLEALAQQGKSALIAELAEI